MEARTKIIESRDTTRRRQFLQSSLPEIEPLTEDQMRIFRRRVLQLIDDIKNPPAEEQLYEVILDTE